MTSDTRIYLTSVILFIDLSLDTKVVLLIWKCVGLLCLYSIVQVVCVNDAYS